MNTQIGQVSAAQFLSLFGNGGVLMFGRHGNALKARPGQADTDRALSSKGEVQVSSIEEQLRGKNFDIVAASSAKRARQTAIMVTQWSWDQLGTIEAMRITEDKTDPCNVMFEALTYSPLSEYFKHEHAEHLRELGRQFLTEVVSLTAAVKEFPDGEAKVFIGGHAVFTPQVVWTLGQLLIDGGHKGGKSLQEFVCGLSLGEAEVIKLTFIGAPEGQLGGIAMEILRP